MTNGIFRKSVFVLGVLCVLGITTLTIIIGQVTVPEAEETTPLAIVVKFWEALKIGDLDEARSYRTDSSGEFKVSVTKSPPPEVWLRKNGYRFVDAKIYRENGDKCVVAVIVERSGKRGQLTLFHDLVQNDEGKWRILAVSY